MKTDDLITALTADLPVKPVPPAHAVARAIAMSLPVATALLVYGIHVRPDFWTVLTTSLRFDFKFVFTLGTLVSALWLALRLSRPGTSSGPAKIALGVTAGALLIAVAAELAALPQATWGAALIGDRAIACMLLIPTLAAAPLAAILYAMRSGAPDDPRVAGAAGGLLAGAIGATLYATHCTNDSPLFLAVWYVIGISAVTLAGSLIGSKVLKW